MQPLHERQRAMEVLPVTELRVGLFDFEDYRGLVCGLCEVLNLEEAEVHERLFRESLHTGWNVSRAAAAAGLHPHVYGEEMESFYSQTDAFVFELAVIHQNPYCQEIDRRISTEIADRFPGGNPAEILVLGDGIGTDSLRLAMAGHSVTYFEFEGHSSAFARFRFERAGDIEHITTIHRLEEIPENRFDVVINREVLEHVPQPEQVIRDIWRYLKPGGLALVTESFSRLEPQFPTHLASNAKFAGQTPRMFVDAGFRVARLAPDWRPMVFEKTSQTDASRYRTIPRRPTVATRLFRRMISSHLVGRVRRSA